MRWARSQDAHRLKELAGSLVSQAPDTQFVLSRDTKSDRGFNHQAIGRLLVPVVTVPSVTLAHKVGPGLQDLQTRARRILAERNAEKAEENTWIGRMVAAESIGELDGLIKSRAT